MDDTEAILKQAAHLIREQAGELAEQLTLEQGKPIGEARSEVNGSADALEFFGEEAVLQFNVVPPSNDAADWSIYE